MKIIIVGGTGLIGNAVMSELKPRHEVITVGYKSGDVQVDIGNLEAIKQMFQHIGTFDALIATTGKVVFGEFSQMNDEKFRIGLDDKLMGQVNLVTIGSNYINEEGSFTLTGGILNHDPIRTGTSAAMVNGALEGFVKSAAIELSRGTRINLVSPTVVTEAMASYGPYFRGYQSVSVATVALAYSKSVEGAQTGQIYRVGYQI